MLTQPFLCSIKPVMNHHGASHPPLFPPLPLARPSQPLWSIASLDHFIVMRRFPRDEM
jgi:hypothetical protein